MVVDVHVHFLSPRAIEAARKAPERYGVRVLDDGDRPRLVIGAEAPTRPLLEPLYTSTATSRSSASRVSTRPSSAHSWTWRVTR